MKRLSELSGETDGSIAGGGGPIGFRPSQVRSRRLADLLAPARESEQARNEQQQADTDALRRYQENQAKEAQRRQQERREGRQQREEDAFEAAKNTLNSAKEAYAKQTGRPTITNAFGDIELVDSEQDYQARQEATQAKLMEEARKVRQQQAATERDARLAPLKQESDRLSLALKDPSLKGLSDTDRAKLEETAAKAKGAAILGLMPEIEKRLTAQYDDKEERANALDRARNADIDADVMAGLERDFPDRFAPIRESSAALAQDDEVRQRRGDLERRSFEAQNRLLGEEQRDPYAPPAGDDFDKAPILRDLTERQTAIAKRENDLKLQKGQIAMARDAEIAAAHADFSQAITGRLTRGQYEQAKAERDARVIRANGSFDSASMNLARERADLDIEVEDFNKRTTALNAPARPPAGLTPISAAPGQAAGATADTGSTANPTNTKEPVSKGFSGPSSGRSEPVPSANAPAAGSPTGAADSPSPSLPTVSVEMRGDGNTILTREVAILDDFREGIDLDALSGGKEVYALPLARSDERKEIRDLAAQGDRMGDVRARLNPLSEADIDQQVSRAQSITAAVGDRLSAETSGLLDAVVQGTMTPAEGRAAVADKAKVAMDQGVTLDDPNAEPVANAGEELGKLANAAVEGFFGGRMSLRQASRILTASGVAADPVALIRETGRRMQSVGAAEEEMAAVYRESAPRKLNLGKAFLEGGKRNPMTAVGVVNMAAETTLALTDPDKLSGPRAANAQKLLDETLAKENARIAAIATKHGLSDLETEAMKLRSAREGLRTRQRDMLDAIAQTVANPGAKMPFTGDLVALAADHGPVIGIALKVKRGEALTQGEEFLLESYLEDTGRDSTLLGNVVDVVSQLPAFGAEIVLTGGIATGAKKTAAAGARKVVGKEIAEAVAKWAAGRSKLTRYLGRGAANVAATAAQTPVAMADKIAADTIRATQIPALDQFEGDLGEWIKSPGQAFGPAARAAFFDAYAELVSEKSGQFINDVGGLAVKGLGKMLPGVQERILRSGFSRALRRLNGTKPITSVSKLARRGQFHGTFTEILEERVGDLIRGTGYELSGGALGEQWQWPTAKQWATEAISFALPNVAFSAINTRAIRGAKRQLRSDLDTVLGPIEALGEWSDRAMVTGAINDRLRDQLAIGRTDAPLSDTDLGAVEDLVGPIRDLPQVRSVRGINDRMSRWMGEADVADNLDRMGQLAQSRAALVTTRAGQTMDFLIAARDVARIAAQDAQSPDADARFNAARLSGVAKIAAARPATELTQAETAALLAPLPSSLTGEASATELNGRLIVTDAGKQDLAGIYGPMIADLLPMSESKARRWAAGNASAAAPADPTAPAKAPSGKSAKPETTKPGTGTAMQTADAQWAAKGRKGTVVSLPANAAADSAEAVEKLSALLPVGEMLDLDSLMEPAMETPQAVTPATESTAPDAAAPDGGATEPGAGLRDTARQVAATLPPALRERGTAMGEAVVDVLEGLNAAGVFPGNISFGAYPDPNMTLQFDPKTGTMRVNLHSLATLTGIGPEWVASAVAEEVIHAVATQVVTSEEAARLWQSLPEELKAVVTRAYHSAYEATGNAGPALTDFAAGHEFLRMVVQDRAFRGMVTEAMDAQSSWTGELLEFLLRLVETLRSLVGALQGESRETVDASANRVIDAMIGMGVRLDYQFAESETVGPEFFETPGSYYRIVVGDAAFQDVVSSGTVRTNAGEKAAGDLKSKLAARPTAFPSFAKDKAAMMYAAENPSHYIIVSQADYIRPSRSGRHGKGWTYFPTDAEGKAMKSMPAADVAIYKHLGNGRYGLVFGTPPSARQEAAMPADSPEARADEMVAAVMGEPGAGESTGSTPPAVAEDATPSPAVSEAAAPTNTTPQPVADSAPSSTGSETTETAPPAKKKRRKPPQPAEEAETPPSPVADGTGSDQAGPLSEGWQKAADAFEGLFAAMRRADDLSALSDLDARRLTNLRRQRSQMGQAGRDTAKIDARIAELERKGGIPLSTAARLTQQSLPPDRLGKFVEAASALIAEGIRTPEDLAAGLDRLAPGGQLRTYSQAFWDAFGMVDNTLRGTHDWETIYAPKTPSSPTVRQGPMFNVVVNPIRADESNSPATVNSEWWKSSVEEWAGMLLYAPEIDGDPIDWRAEKAKAAKAGASAKEIDEAIEYAFTLAAKKTANTLPRELVFDALVALHSRQPILSAKTSTSKINQAYSTPAPMAWTAEVLAKNSAPQILAEPSAGNGMLLIGSSPDQTLYVNEIDPRRREKLEDTFAANQQTGQISGEDAVTWTPPTPPTRVIANPPFGQIMEEGGNNRVFQVPYGETTQIDFAIMLRSLETMAPDGRAVFIIGGPPPTVKTAPHKAKYYASGGKGRFFSHLYENYNVIDHFTVSGDLYAKQGAGWPVDFITIDGKGKSRKTLPGSRPPRTIETWEALAAELDRTDDERIDINRLTEAELRDDAGQLADGLAEIGRRPDRPTDSEGGSRQVDAELGGPTTADAGREGGTVRGNRPGNQDSTRSSESGSDQLGEIGGNEIRGAAQDQRVSAGVAVSASDYQTAYEPVAGVNAAGLLAPVNLAGPMRTALERLREEVGSLPAYVAEKLGYPEGTDISQYFFGDQIDALAQAIAQVEKGGALVVGDQTGTGKGRVVAGLMKYAIKEGRIPVFVTKDQTLYDAMMDDLTDIGASEVSPIISDQEIKEKTLKDKLKIRNGLNGRKAFERVYQTGEMPVGTNALFLSYPQISSDTPPGTNSLIRNQARQNNEAPPGYWRMDALKAIAPRGLFIFDESHLASGASTTGFRLGELLSTEGAQVYYSSATFAKRPDNMGLYFRTNLGQAAGSITGLMKLMTDGGVPAMQVASSMLASDGQYLRRERSYAGVRFETIILEDSYERDKALADNYTEGLRAIIDVQNRMQDAAAAINAMVAKVGKKWDVPTGQRVRLEADNFSAKLHNMVRQYLFAIKADETARRAVKAITEGHPDTNGVIRPHKVIVAVENTMESGIKALRDGGFPMTFNGMLEYYLDRQRTFVVSKGAFGKGRVEWTLPKVGNPEFKNLDDAQLQLSLVYTSRNDAGEKTVNVNEAVLKELTWRAMNGTFLEAESRIKQMQLAEMPLSPIDHMRQVVEAAGIRTAEMTGRAEGIDADGRIYTRDPDEIKGRLAAKDAFNNGPVDFLIINKSGSTGVSMHASPKFGDTRPRLMFVAQPNLDINEFMQTLGRIHRAGQVETPSYALVQAALPAEKRPAAILGAKMAMLNANTTSNADSEVSRKEGVDLFNKYGDAVVHGYLLRNPSIARQVDHSWGKLLNEKGEIYPLSHFTSEENGGGEAYLSRGVTGHLAILTVEEQEDFWGTVEDEYRSMIAYLDEIGANDLRATVMDLRAKTVSSKLFTPGSGGDSVFSEPSYIETAEVKMGKKPPEWEETSKAAAKASSTSSTRQSDYLSESEAWIEAEDARKASRAINWEKKRDRWRKEMREARNRIASTVGMIGSFGTYKRGDGTVGWAWIADVEIDQEKPLTPSAQTVIVMVNDGKVRMRVPLSQIADFFNLQTFGAADGWQSTYDFGSQRQIVTGNLIDAIRGLGKTGQIISYSTESGETKMGILLPAGYSKEEAKLSSRNIPVKTREAFEKAISAGQSVFSDAVRFRVTPNTAFVDLIVPASRSAGGKYWRDPILNRMMRNGEFVEKSGRMVGQIDNGKAVEVFRYLTETVNEELFTTPSSSSDEEKDPLSAAQRIQTAADETDGGGVALYAAARKLSDLHQDLLEIWPEAKGLDRNTVLFWPDNSIDFLRERIGRLSPDRQASVENWFAENEGKILDAQDQLGRDRIVATLDRAAKDGDYERFAFELVDKIKENSSETKDLISAAGDIARAGGMDFSKTEQAVRREFLTRYGNDADEMMSYFFRPLSGGDARADNRNPASDSILYAAPRKPASSTSPGVPEDHEAIRDALKWITGKKMPSQAEMEALSEKARGEASGERTVGNPDIANYADTDEVRREIDVVRQAYEDQFESQTQEMWERQARAMIKKDADGVMRHLVEAAREGRAIEKEFAKAAQLLTPRMFRHAIATGDKAAMRDAQAVAWAVNIIKSEQGRALAAWRDPFKSPAERHEEFLARIISKVPPPVQARADKAPTPAEKNRRIDELKRRIAELTAQEVVPAQALADAKAELARVQRQKDRSEILEDAHRRRLEAIEKALASMGVTLHDIFSNQAVVRLRGSEIVARVIEGQFSKPERAALRAMIDGFSNRQIAKQTGIDRNALPALEARFRKVMRQRFLELAQRGLSLRDFEQTDAGMFDLSKRISEEGDVLRAADRPGDSGIDPESAADEMLKALMPDTDARNAGRVRRPKPGAPAGGGRFDITNRTHVAQAARTVQAAVDSNAFDMVYEYWINNILSGPQTHAVNITGNALNLAFEYGLQRWMEAAFNTLVRSEDGAQWGEYKWMAKMLPSAWAPALEHARLAWATEESFFEADVLRVPTEIGTPLDKLGGSGARTAIPGKAGRIIRIPGRALLFMDTLFKAVIGHIEVGAQAYRIAKSEGLSGAAMDSRIRSLINLPGSAAWIGAVEKSRELTFTTPLRNAQQGGGTVERLVKKMQDERRDKRHLGNTGAFILGWVFPFIQTPFNIFKSGLRRTPLGLLGIGGQLMRAGFYQWNPDKNARQPFSAHYSSARLVRDLTDQTIAWLITGLLWAISEGDPDDDDKELLVTGGRPFGQTREGERSILDRTEGGPFQLRLGKRNQTPIYLDFGRLEPMATILATTTDAVRAAKRIGNGTTARDEIAKLYYFALDQAKDKTFLAGIEKIHSAVSGEAPLVGRKDIIQGIVPNLIRQPLRNLDDYVRNTKTAPWYYEALPLGGFAEPRYDLYGQPIEKAGTPLEGVIGQPIDRLLRVVADTGIRPMPTKTPADRALINYARENPQDTYFPSRNSITTGKNALGETVPLTREQIAELERRGGQQFRIDTGMPGSPNQVTPPEAVAPTADTIKKIRDARSDAYGPTRDAIMQEPKPKPRKTLDPRGRSLAELLGWGES